MKEVVLVGCGVRADHYMRSFEVMRDMRVAAVHDPIRPDAKPSPTATAARRSWIWRL